MEHSLSCTAINMKNSSILYLTRVEVIYGQGMANSSPWLLSAWEKLYQEKLGNGTWNLEQPKMTEAASTIG